MTQKARILVVDDHPFFRRGVVQWLNQQDEVFCCGEADSVLTARAAVAELQPDVVLLDLHLTGGDGLDLIQDISSAHPAARIIVLSQRDEDVYAHRALRAGARGYVMKSEATETVLEAIATVLRGEPYVSRPVAARALHKLFPDPLASTPEIARLSDRELQVFQLLGADCSTREISSVLKISPKTVETYREHLKQKLDLPDSDALLAAATRWVSEGKLS
ncbi:MAG: response regulator transcription factor [Verrucomicrobiota bacterium]